MRSISDRIRSYVVGSIAGAGPAMQKPCANGGRRTAPSTVADALRDDRVLRAVRGGDTAQPVLDLVHGLASRRQGAPQVEQELLELGERALVRLDEWLTGRCRQLGMLLGLDSSFSRTPRIGLRAAIGLAERPL